MTINGIELPRHGVELIITHNPHKSNYESVDDCYLSPTWANEQEHQLAVETDDFWHVQWYPDTPTGFYSVSACNLNVALEFARQVQIESDEERRKQIEAGRDEVIKLHT